MSSSIFPSKGQEYINAVSLVIIEKDIAPVEPSGNPKGISLIINFSGCKELEITSSNLWVMLYRARSLLRCCLEINWFGEVEM